MVIRHDFVIQTC